MQTWMLPDPLIEIKYCRLCGWSLRAGWMAQELLTTLPTKWVRWRS